MIMKGRNNAGKDGYYPFRSFFMKIAVAGVLALFIFGNPVSPFQNSLAQAKELQKVVISFGVKTIDITEAFLYSVPHPLGYYEEEGLSVELQRVAGGSAAVKMLASGSADFSSHGTAGLLAAVGQGVPIKGFICQVPDYFVSLAVLKSSPITDVTQLKGKTIGVNAVGGSPHIVAQGVFKKLGMAEDVQYLAVGTGVPAINALERGRVDALIMWDSIFALFEFHGYQLRYFRPEPIPSMGFTHTTNTLISTITNKPDLVRGVARAMAKSLVFMAAVDPVELAKLHYSQYPESKGAGLSEADAIKLAIYQLRAREPFMQNKCRIFDRCIKLGGISKEKIESYRDIVFAAGKIPEALPAERYFTDQFVDDMNKIDFDGIIKMARNYKFK